ncbi:transposase [Bradyrhizobium sp. i1.8.4]|uniref:helix-turn-helix domain-containing protein n=1 Tax=unclassified Bradyrhizobium TaxID=2631580 RepID=UPI003D1E15A3
MAKPLSPDLRLRIVRAVEDEGMSCRGAAGRFGVAPSTAIELVREWRSTGGCEARAQGGDGVQLGSSGMLQRYSPWSRLRLT